MTGIRKLRHLPIVFRCLDIEEKTKPVPTLVCPVRSDLMTVGNCGRCVDFRRIEFTKESRPVLCCAARRNSDGDAALLDPRVQDVLRVPVLCTASDTTLAVVLPYLGLALRSDAIPILDGDARPIGRVTIDEARRLVASGIPLETSLSEVMSQQIVCVLPETSLKDARHLLIETEAAQLFAVAADGSFLGDVTPSDLGR